MIFDWAWSSGMDGWVDFGDKTGVYLLFMTRICAMIWVRVIGPNIV